MCNIKPLETICRNLFWAYNVKKKNNCICKRTSLGLRSLGKVSENWDLGYVENAKFTKTQIEVLDQDSICIKCDLVLGDSRIYCCHQLVLWSIVVAFAN
jgi:hypothetical protein